MFLMVAIFEQTYCCHASFHNNSSCYCLCDSNFCLIFKKTLTHLNNETRHIKSEIMPRKKLEKPTNITKPPENAPEKTSKVFYLEFLTPAQKLAWNIYQQH